MTRESKFSHDVINNYHRMIEEARRPKCNMHRGMDKFLPALLKDKWTHNEHLRLLSLQISYDLKKKTKKQLSSRSLKLKQRKRIPTELLTNISPQPNKEWYLFFPNWSAADCKTRHTLVRVSR